MCTTLCAKDNFYVVKIYEAVATKSYSRSCAPSMRFRAIELITRCSLRRRPILESFRLRCVTHGLIPIQCRCSSGGSEASVIRKIGSKDPSRIEDDTGRSFYIRKVSFEVEYTDRTWTRKSYRESDHPEDFSTELIYPTPDGRLSKYTPIGESMQPEINRHSREHDYVMEGNYRPIGSPRTGSLTIGSLTTDSQTIDPFTIGRPLRKPSRMEREAARRASWIQWKAAQKDALDRQDSYRRRGLSNDCAIVLDVPEDFTAMIAEVRKQYPYYANESPVPYAFVFDQLEVAKIALIKDELVRFTRKIRPFKIMVTQVRLIGNEKNSHLTIRPEFGKNDLGNVIGRLKYQLVKKRRREKKLPPRDQTITGNMVHWLLGRFDGVERDHKELKEILRARFCFPTFVTGLKLLKRNLLQRNKWEVLGTYKFTKAPKQPKRTKAERRAERKLAGSLKEKLKAQRELISSSQQEVEPQKATIADLFATISSVP